MAWYPQVRDCCGLGGGFGRVSGQASICVWAWGWPKSRARSPYAVGLKHAHPCIAEGCLGL